MTTLRRLGGSLLATSALTLALAGCSSAPVTPAPKEDPMAGVPESIQFIKNVHEICGPITGGAKNSLTEARIQRFRTLLGKSPTGTAMLKNAETFPDKDGVRPLWICFEKMAGSRTPYAYYSWGRGVTVINTHMYDYPVDEGKQIAAAVHELRHSEQDRTFQNIRYANRAEAQMATYASEADAESVALLVSYEMKQGGYSGAWGVRSAPDNFMQGYFCFAGLHRSFEQAVHNGGSKADATRAVFRSWHDNKPILHSYQGQANMRWGMQESRDELKQKWEREDRERAAAQKLSDNRAHSNAEMQRLAPRPADGELIPHNWTTCQLPRTEVEAAITFELPNVKYSDKLDQLGTLPDGSANYLEEGGGVRNILRHKAKDAYKLSGPSL